MSIIERLKEEDKNVLFIAIDTLENKEEIIQFYHEYINYLRDEEGIKGDIKGIALGEIGYVTGYYTHKVQRLWAEALGDIIHPTLGDLFDSKDVSEIYQKGRKDMEKRMENQKALQEIKKIEKESQYR